MVLLNLVYCELLKLKRSKMIIISIADIMATPCMMLIEALQNHFEHPNSTFTLSTLYDNSLLYVMLIINLMIYVAITAYLFSREYTENTLKTILPIPVSRSSFIISKFTILLIWVLMLTFFTWLGLLILSGIYNAVIGIDKFYFSVALKWLAKFLIGNTLMFFTISPLAYIAEKSKGLVVPMITSAIVVMANAALCNQKLGALSPWTSPYLIMSGKIKGTGYPIALSAIIIIFISLIGFLLTFRYFKKEDLK